MIVASLLLCILLLTTPGSLGGYSQEGDNYQHTICVTSSSASEWCRNENVCSSFECIQSSIRGSTVVLFEAMDNITLDSCLWFSDVYHIAFAGLNSQGTRIICNASKAMNNSGAGFRFDRVRDLKLVGLNFERCGALHDSTTLNTQTQNSTLKFNSSIYILNSSNVTIENVSIEQSSGIALTFFDTTGTVNVTSSNFIWNLVPESEKKTFPGGGGVYVEFTYCSPGIVGICDKIGKQNKFSEYHFQDCMFTNNNATSLNIRFGSHYAHAVGTKFQGLGRGGGLNIVFKGNAKDNSIHIQNCIFLNNTAVWGGGLYVGFQDSVRRNTVVINRSIFESNVCRANAGGGADVGYLFLKPLHKRKTSSTNNTIHFQSCVFRKNRARYGGGVAVYSNKHHKDLNNSIEFTNCIWEENIARFGSAVDVEPLIMWDSLGATDGILPSLVFEDSNFTSNIGIPEVIGSDHDHPWEQTKDSEGGFTAIGFTINFKGKLHFENHVGSAMYVVSCILEFHSETHATFVNNSGFAGGAISLVGLSWMYVSDNSTFTFINNTATDRGGAISVQSTSKQDLILSHTCFIMYKGSEYFDTRNIEFEFNENTVRNLGNTGNSIFLTSLQPCQRECRRAEMNDSEIPFHCIGTFSYDNDSKPKSYEISTEGGGFKLANETNSPPLKVIPGKEFQLPFFSEDDLEQKISSHYSVAVENTENSEIRIDEAYSHISRDRLKLCGKPGDKGRIVLSRLGFRRTLISFDVHMQNCPPGFIVSRDNISHMACTCGRESYVGILRCGHDAFQAYIHRGFWIGYVDNREKVLLSGYCPSRFCFHYGNEIAATDHLLPNVSSREELDKVVCGPTRTGKLCGDCRKNYSAYFHSTNFRCDNSDYCAMGLFFYAISELLPLTVLFLIVMIFNISFTSGAVNSFIFFAQVIDSMNISAKNFIWFPPAVYHLTKIYNFVYRFFNLDFFSINLLSFCLWEGAKSIDVIAFKYVTVVYALLLVFATITLMNVCNCYRFCRCIKPRTVKSSVIHGISAFLVMCYAQSTKISFLILSPSYLCYEGHNCSDHIVHYHGDTVYLSKAHLPYALPAIFCLLIVTGLPTILLLVYPAYYKILALLRLNENRKLQQISRKIPIAKLKPFFDSFQSCYKGNFRFFSGLYFVYRLSILVISSFSISFTWFYTIIEVQLILMLVIHALAQPYEKRWHNAVDILIFADLAVINGISSFNYDYTKETGFQDRVNIASSLQLVLIYLPMVYLVMYSTLYLISKIIGYFKCKDTREHINDFDFPARLIYGDEDIDSENGEYREFEEHELQASVNQLERV